MKKNIGSKLALYPMPITVIGAMNGDKPTWTLVGHLGIIGHDPNARPAISGSVDNMEQYDIVFIGYPIWWGEAPRIMSTFVENYDFSGKTLIAFCTSASSGFGSSDSALKSATGTATWLDGRRFSAGASAEDVLAWADGLGIRYENRCIRG